MDWLRKQYHGEVTAAQKMLDFILLYGENAKNSKWVDTVNEIAEQEKMHAMWIGGLLIVRGEKPGLLANKQERYWDATLPGIDSWESGCAVAAHAEKMRLERIRVIVADPEAPEDIREVFGRILPQEEFHEKAFRTFAGDEAMTKALENHITGQNALGLVT